MWWILPVPESIENQFAKSGKSKSDRASLHSSLAVMRADEQEEVVKKLIKFWIRKDQANVPDHVKDWVDHPKPVPQVVPYGEMAPTFIDMPKVSPLELGQYRDNVFIGDIIGEIAATDLHILIATKTGAGKSTTLKAVIHRILKDNSAAKFTIIDPKTTDWLGLQRSSNCVTYLEQDTTSEQLDAALRAIEKTFDLLQARKNAKQQALKNDGEIPKFASQYLIIDEWFSVYDSVKRQKRDDAFMEPLNQIVAQGRELKVHLILVGQSHLCGEIGFSTAMRRSFAVLAQGRMGKNCDVGYEPITATIEDPNMFRNKSEREALTERLQSAILIAQKDGDRPVLLTTMGIAKIALLPDLKFIDGLKQ
jgi:energy-coupling factor transporter ATP-binding protein EcfA2